MLVLVPLIILALVALGGAYVGLVWLCARLSRDRTLWRRAVAAAALAWATAIAVLRVGVPLSLDAKGPPPLPVWSPAAGG